MKNLFNAVDNNSNGRLFLPTNSWRALRQRLLRTPELALVSLAGTRCSKIDTSLQLSINSELSVSSLSPNSCNQHQVTAAIHSKHFLTNFPSFPQWNSWITFTWMNSFWNKIWAAPSLFIEYFLKDCLGLSWVNCHLMSHLLRFHFLGESWPQI